MQEIKLLATIVSAYKKYKHEKTVTENFLFWVKRNLSNGCGVEIRLHTQNFFYKMQSDKLMTVRAGSRVQFVLTTPYEFMGEIAGVRPVRIFLSDLWCVYEYPVSPKPLLRHGLNEEQKKAALGLVRNHISRVLSGDSGDGGYLSDENDTFLSDYAELATVDVMLWLDGEMRGSKIYTGSSLIESLRTGVVLSACDDRFKPLARHELSKVRFEINILSDLQLPVIASETGGLETTIQPQCGYVAKYGSVQGWYLPVIFNVKKFASLYELLRSLAHDKTRIPVGLFRKVSFFAFPIEIFRESVLNEGVVDQVGPLCAPEVSKLKLTDITIKTELMAHWLCTLGDSDGYLPLKADPYTKKTHITDWPRMAFAAFALGWYGRTFNNEVCIRQADRTAVYIRKVYEILNQSPQQKAIVSAYVGRLAVLEGDGDIASAEAANLLAFVEKNPNILVISSLQIASFFDELQEVNSDGAYKFASEKLIDQLYIRWEEMCTMGTEVSFAEYAELLPLLYRRSLTESNVKQEQSVWRYEMLRAWYQKNQFEDGAFPNTTRSNFCYTRGTGKIWEALAVDPANEGMCFKAAQYILSLQYHPEAMFNIPPHLATQFAGAVMHDEVNHEAWTDSVGHVLIAVARMSQRLESKDRVTKV